MIKDYIKKVQSGEIDIVEKTKEVLASLEKVNAEYGYMNTISKELALAQAEVVKKNPTGKLAGVFISTKDSIVVKDVETTGGSAILKGYKPVFNATAVQKLIDEGAIIIGKCSQDEFGFGAFSTNIGHGLQKPLNPFDKERACGGSSGGSGGISQKADFVHVSLGESTGGSIVNPASFCGVFGLCPTYGKNSRYGLIDYGNSLDKIGPMSTNLEALSLVQDVMAGFDELDSTSLNEPVEPIVGELSVDVKGIKIGIIKEAFADGTNVEVFKANMDAIKKLEEKGAIVEEVSLATTIKYGIPTYYIVGTAEASTNLAKYAGLRYGASDNVVGKSFNDYFTGVRTENFGLEVKRRIMLGTFTRMAGYRDAYYIKALKVRTKIINEYKELFSKFDVLISPTVPFVAPKFSDIDKMSPLQHYMADVMTVGPNLAGLPHMNIPVGFDKDGMPIGMMVTADHNGEGKLIQVAKEFDNE